MANPISRIPFAPLGALLVQSVRNGGVHPLRLHRLLGLILRYTAVEPFRLAERFIFDRKIASHQLEHDPIFILGHWRSGTSYLQTLLGQDPELATSTLYRSVFADISLVTEPWLKPILNRIARALRLPFSFQRLPLDLDIPAEADVGLCSLLSPYSYTWGHVFPTRLGEWMERLVLDPTPEAGRGWLNHYDTFIRKLSLASHGRRIVMKTPGDTARVRLLLRQYPNAQFIYIHRDPIAVFHSSGYFWSVIRREFALQKISDSQVEDAVLTTYSALLESYLEQRQEIPAGQLTELRCESLQEDPVAELSRVYNDLSLGELPSAIKLHLSQQAHYPATSYTTSPELEKRLRRVWAFSFLAWPMPPDTLRLSQHHSPRVDREPG